MLPINSLNLLFKINVKLRHAIYVCYMKYTLPSSGESIWPLDYLVPIQSYCLAGSGRDHTEDCRYNNGMTWPEHT